jgi:DNA repair protein RecN (Recombination protein N)
MLSSLHIKDLAIIDELCVEFGAGLNVMTGETGAGKTIIVEALKLVLGSRVQPEMVRAGRDRASVTAVFDAACGLTPLVRETLEQASVEIGPELIINRTIAGQGRGRIAINGVPVTQSVLKQVAEHLVDVSSQHEHQLLLEPAEHALTLDAFGGLGDRAKAYRDVHLQFAKLSREVEELEASEAKAKDKLDFLKFQLDELKGADLKPDEDKEIETQINRLKNAVTLEEQTRTAEGALYGDSGSASEMLGHAQQQLSQCARFETRAQSWLEALERARSEIEEVARDLRSYADGLESDPARLEELGDRLHRIRHLMRKHGGSVESCIKRRDEIAAEIDTYLNYDHILAEKKKVLSELGASRCQSADRWSKARREAAKGLGQAVAVELASLGMKKTQFAVHIEPRPESEWDESGPDAVEFIISPNVGEPMRPLARIASGGELSRVMLALKGVLSERAQLATTTVFDEVDSGIGGAIAEVVGMKLKEISRTRQIICITHLPQVAIHGDQHILISKRVDKGRTIASLAKLSHPARVEEIARMLGGTRITEATMRHAREMLRLASRD